jgi:cytochrome c peroxidase
MSPGRAGVAAGALLLVAGLLAAVYPRPAVSRVDTASSPTLPPTAELPFVTTEPLLGLPDLPESTAASAERAALGRDLFFDPILSEDRTVSCASCHDPQHGYSDPRARSTGIRGQRTERHAPTLVNRAYGHAFSWDGRFDDLAAQMLGPIRNPREMGLPIEAAVERLVASAYAPRFARAFGGGPSDEHLAEALAAFVRTIRIGDSPIDRFRAAVGRLTPEQRAGLWIYESKGRCWRCHSGANFTDERFHNTGVGVVGGRAEPGRAAVTGRDEDRGAFKTPTLRGLEFTAPYMHDGSLPTLREVVDFYRRGGGPNPDLDEALEPIELSDEEAEHLVAFLEALSASGD